MAYSLVQTRKEFLRDVAMWEVAYRHEHVNWRQPSELIADGWEKDWDGEWCHPQMERLKNRVFRERSDELLLLSLLA